MKKVKWTPELIETLLTLKAKGLPFESLVGTFRRYYFLTVTREELKEIYYQIARGEMEYDGEPNNSMSSHDWLAREIKLLKYLRAHNAPMRRARQFLCRTSEQLKTQWKLINRPIL